LKMEPIPVLHPITRLIVGGAQENTLYTAALLDKTRFKVDVLCGPQTGSEGSLIEEGRQRGVPVTILPELVRQVSPLNDLLATWKMARLMKAGSYQIVHTHSSKAGILGRIAARLAGVPVIVHSVHGWSFHEHMPLGTRLIYITLERLAASFSHALIAVADRDIRKGLRHGIGRADQYHLIRSAIPLEEFDPSLFDRSSARRELGLPPQAPVLGNVGRFSAQKNPLDWVRVAGMVRSSLPEARFVLVGGGPLRDQVEAALKDEGLWERAVLTGLRRDVARMMSAMDVFLLTSLWEGLPRVIPQAMSMRLPVVASAVDGSSEAIQDGITGFICPPGDLDRIAQRCLELLTDPALRGQIGLAGRQYAQSEFDLDIMVRKIEDLYDKLISQTGNP
jgi:glycosyltransferase involved in cell wall biosynthesis